MKKKISSIGLIIALIMLLTACNQSFYRSLIDNEFNKNIDQRQFTEADIPREGWSEVDYLSSDGRDKKAFLRLGDKAKLNVIYVHGYYWKGKFSYFDSILDGYLQVGREDDFNILAVELSGWGQQRMDRFEDFAYDILGGAQYLQDKDPDLPTVIVGHSMGGYAVLLAAHFDTEDLLDGVVALAPVDNMANAAKYREINGEKQVPWYKRAFVDLTDKRLDAFFSSYDINNLAEEIDVPVVIVTGKEDDHPFPAMAMKIYESLEGEKDLYLLDNTFHSWLNFSNKNKMDMIFEDFFAKIKAGENLENRELNLSSTLEDNEDDFKLIVDLDQEIIEEYKPVDLAFREGFNFGHKKISFSEDNLEQSFKVSFNPEQIYGVSPKLIDINGDIWNYKFLPEEEAFYLLSKSEANSYEELDSEELEAIDLLIAADEIFYGQWAAKDFLLKGLNAYEESIAAFKEILEGDIHENLAVKYTYFIYEIYRDALKDLQMAEYYYEQLIEYEDDKYYVAKAIDYERRNLDYKNIEYRVAKISVEGLERSDDEIVIKQLSYDKGERWSDKEQSLTEQRLYNSTLFNPLELSIDAKEIRDGEVEVNIRAGETNPLMVHPVEFAVFKALDLYNSQITQFFRNPFGKGVNLYLGYSWKSEPYNNFLSGPWWEVGVSYVGNKGRVYSWNYKDFESHKEFNNQNYTIDGFKTGVQFDQVLRSDLKLRSKLNYQQNNYIKDYDIEQEYIIVGAGLDWDNYGHLSIDLDYGISLNDDRDFNRLALQWRRFEDVGDDKLVYSLRGGLASSNTPLNYQFQGGGYSFIPLRGSEFDMAGSSYLTTNLEYHRSLLDDSIFGISFLDVGKIIEEGNSFSQEEWSFSGGLGLVVNTPLGPLRGDFALDLKEKDRTFNINFGHTF
ncbi:alpha/beta fold hydrolase [Halonatronum saccharophilum]|uniref:alpha/beta fold hydrolase n=1 Tax=Halonatronum saccharophilum TaxID=150060 RepID=UPI000487C189|nr:alpha/beta fold hydrolase [Halonatronum saccharophilum]